MNRQEKAAADFCAAIKEIASKPENLDNLESYLSAHFAAWLQKYAHFSRKHYPLGGRKEGA